MMGSRTTYALLALLLVAGGIVGILVYPNSQIPGLDLGHRVHGVDPGHRTNVLIMGLDQVSSLTDTIMVASFDTVSKSASLLSIPRDTRVYLAGSDNPRYEKINAAYTDGGNDLARSAVESLLGIEIDYCLTVDINGVAAFVDSIGGVEIEVLSDMDYDDPSQDLHIHLRAGLQVLDGDKAVQFLRYRSGYDDADLGRIRAQQSFLRATAKKLISPATMFRLDDVVRSAFAMVETDMPLQEILAAVVGLRSLSLDQITMETLPGENRLMEGVWYIVVKAEEAALTIDRLLWSIDRETNAGIRLAVLYDPDLAEAAEEVMGGLARAGFEIVEVVTVEVPEGFATTVITHQGDRDHLVRVARSLAQYLDGGRPAANFFVRSDAEPEADVTVVLGRDLGR